MQYWAVGWWSSAQRVQMKLVVSFYVQHFDVSYPDWLRRRGGESVINRITRDGIGYYMFVLLWRYNPSLFYSVFTSDSLACDCALKTLIQWKEQISLSRNIALKGSCFSSKYLQGRSIDDLSSTEIKCGKLAADKPCTWWATDLGAKIIRLYGLDRPHNNESEADRKKSTQIKFTCLIMTIFKCLAYHKLKMTSKKVIELLPYEKTYE